MKAPVFFGLLLTCFINSPAIAGDQCQQCIPYAREITGLNFYAGKLGGANELWAAAKAKEDSRNKYTSNIPNIGRTPSLMLLPQQGVWINTRAGHTAAITSSKKVLNRYMLKVSHSNVDGKCKKETGIDAVYYPHSKKVKFVSGHFAGQTLNVIGFIVDSE